MATRCVRSVSNWKCKWKMENENGLKLNYNTKYKDSMVYSTVLEYKSLMHHMIVSIFRFESLAQCSLSTRQKLYKLFVSSPHRWMEQGIHLKMKIADGSHSIIWLSRMNHVIVQFFFFFSRFNKIINNINRCLSSLHKTHKSSLPKALKCAYR